MDPVKRAAEVEQIADLLRGRALHRARLPQELQGINTGSWTGWVRYPSNGGTVFFSNDNIDSYRFVHPKPVAASSSGARGLLLVVAIVIAALVAGGVVLLRSRRRAAVEEA